MYETEEQGKKAAVVGYLGSKTKTRKEIEQIYMKMAPMQYLHEEIEFKNIRYPDMLLLQKELNLTYLILEKEDNEEKFVMYYLQKCDAKDTKDSQVNHLLQVNQKGKRVFINQSQIRYMERSKRTTNIHTVKEVITTSEKLDDLLKRMSGDIFVRCHVSFAINILYVKTFCRTVAELERGEKIPISRKYCQSVRDILGKN